MKIFKLSPKDYFGSNTYVLLNGNNAILIDCSVYLKEILEINKDINIVAVLLTHTHFDHYLTVNAVCEKFNCPVYVMEGFENRLKDMQLNLSKDNNWPMLLNNNIKIKIFKNNEILCLNNEKIKVFSTKGHSECSTCFLIGEEIFSGDTLFNRAIGRYDLFDSNKSKMLESLKLLSTLKFKNGYPGHDENYDYETAMKTIRIYIKYLEK